MAEIDAALPREVKVACIQFLPVFGDKDANLSAMARDIRKAAHLGAEIVVLPELADSGYVFNTAPELAGLAEAIPGGRSAESLIALARELGIHIVSGLAESDAGRFYNSAILCGPDGYIGKYRKLHLWNRENLFFAPGDLGLPVFDTRLGRIGIAICYDGWFPETFRQLALNGAELVCVPTNWVPMPGSETQQSRWPMCCTRRRPIPICSRSPALTGSGPSATSPLSGRA